MGAAAWLRPLIEMTNHKIMAASQGMYALVQNLGSGTFVFMVAIKVQKLVTEIKPGWRSELNSFIASIVLVASRYFSRLLYPR